MRTLFITALFAAVAAPPATAQPSIVVDSKLGSARVSYADLNLSNPQGVETLRYRVRSAATSLCAEGGAHDVSRQSRNQACFKAAMADADRQVAQAVAFYGR